MKLILVMSLLVSAVAFGDEVKTSKEKSKSSVQELVKKVSSERKKKVEMCHDCGKPEAECDCEGEGHKPKK